VSDIATDELRQYIGRRELRSEVLSPVPARLLAATVDWGCEPIESGSVMPPLFHWLHFLPACAQSNLGPDGHPARGEFLPPTPLPRRMWAASSIDFLRPLYFGERATRATQITDIACKQGRSGTLLFVKLQHVVTNEQGLPAIEETQQLVYRNHPRNDEPAPPIQPAPAEQTWVRELRPDPVLLFRYSALTFNSHRIHYDQDYATGVEGYPALVVHAPLVATLLMNLLVRNLPGAQVRHFEFRALRPLFIDAPFRLCAAPEADGSSFDLWSRNAAGALCMDAHVTLASRS
jgi:3-methylfumaryl-CoA hydratase